MTSPPDPTEQRYLDELLAAMRGPCEAAFPATPDAETTPELRFPSDATSAPRVPFLSKRFEKEFRTTLLIHHYFLRAPLATNSFEAAFVRAARAGGHEIRKAPEGQRFWDVEMDGLRISLKSTAAADLRVQSLHISKLCEAGMDSRRSQCLPPRRKHQAIVRGVHGHGGRHHSTTAVQEEGVLRNG